MPIRLRQSNTIAISSGLKETKDLGNITWEVVTDGLNEGGVWKTVVLAGAVNTPLNIDNISTISFLAIKTTSRDPTRLPVALDFRRNAVDAEIFTIEPLPATKEGHFMITTNSMTALYVTNSGAVDMEVIVVACGD